MLATRLDGFAEILLIERRLQAAGFDLQGICLYALLELGMVPHRFPSLQQESVVGYALGILLAGL